MHGNLTASRAELVAQWILQDRSQFVEKMGVKRYRKGKGRLAATEAEAAASEWGHKLLTRYKGAVEANPSNKVLLSVGGKVEDDKNRGDGGSADGGRGGGSGIVSIRPPHYVIVRLVNGFHSFYQTDTRQTLSMHEAKMGISDQSNNMTRFMMQENLKANGVELAAEKVASNRGRVRRSGHSPPPPPQLIAGRS